MSKYYTPTPEEFHVGFQYEFRPRLRQGFMSYINNKFEYIDWWKSQTIGKRDQNIYQLIDNYTDPFSVDDVLEFLQDNAIRVKHLDQEDIESLGYKADMGAFRSTKPIHEQNQMYVFIEGMGGEEVEITFRIQSPSYSCVKFEGNIKNISELKRILKQIGAL